MTEPRATDCLWGNWPGQALLFTAYPDPFDEELVFSDFLVEGVELLEPRTTQEPQLQLTPSFSGAHPVPVHRGRPNGTVHNATSHGCFTSYGTTGDDATAVCSFAAKKSTNCVRTFAAGHSPITVASCRRTCGRSAVRSRPAAGRIIDAVHSRAPTSMLRRGDVQAIWAATASELVRERRSRAVQNLSAIRNF